MNTQTMERPSAESGIQATISLSFRSLVFVFVVFDAVFCASTVTRLRYRLREELTPPVYLGDISADSRFHIVPSPRLPVGFFFVNETSGALWTNVSVDRESICLSRNETCLVQFEATTDLFDVFQVTIEIEDINDNSPEFPHPSVTVSITEDARPEVTGILLPSAEDPDFGDFGLQRYEIFPDSDAFGLTNTTPGDTGELFLVLKKRLDYETSPNYTLKVIAFDGGIPPRTGALLVNVSVEDVNDNAPVFDRDAYNVTVFRSLSPGQSVLGVHADDRDSGRNGQVVYSIASQTTSAYGNLFAVTNDSGELYVTRPIILLNVAQYSIQIQAEDKGTLSRKSVAKVWMESFSVFVKLLFKHINSVYLNYYRHL